MFRVLIAYATDEGQTKKIAHFVRDTLEASGCVSSLMELCADTAAPDFSAFDAILVAGSIHVGRHQKFLEDFVSTNKHALSRMPAGFISVSLSAGSSHPVERSAADRYVAMFCERTGWQPDTTHCAAGAIRSAKTPFLRRLVVHAMVAKNGIALDPSGEAEFTDWDALHDFLEAFKLHLACADQSHIEAAE